MRASATRPRTCRRRSVGSARARASGGLLRTPRHLPGRVPHALRGDPARLLDDTRHAPAEYHDGLTAAKTFALAIEEAAKLHPAAEPLIVYAAMLAPEPIPMFLFVEGREKFGEPLASALEGEGLDEAMAALRGFALLELETIVDERDVRSPPVASVCTCSVRQVAQSVTPARHERADTWCCWRS